jgi:hypothetical protein
MSEAVSMTRRRFFAVITAGLAFMGMKPRTVEAKPIEEPFTFGGHPVIWDSYTVTPPRLSMQYEQDKWFKVVRRG